VCIVNIRGVWATTATRETFSTANCSECVEDCIERGPQYLAAQARVRYAFYEYPDGAVLVVVVRDVLVSMMTGAGLEVKWCRLRGA
jgi:hypothetical protein